MTHRVLVIDDDVNDVDILRDAVLQRSLAIEIDHARDGATALQSLAQCGHYAHQPKPDLILLDHMLPGLNGGEVLKLLKESQDWRSIPVIAFTCVTNRDTHRLCREGGVAACVLKPSTWSAYVDLAGRLIACLDDREGLVQRLATLDCEVAT